MRKDNMKKRIYYHDTDCGGVVYYANYLKYLEEGRTEYCDGRGVDLADYARKGVLFAVSHIEADYKKPARYGDAIEVKTSVEKIGNCSIIFEQEIKKDRVTLFDAKVVLVCVDTGLKPHPLPPEMKKRLGEKHDA